MHLSVASVSTRAEESPDAEADDGDVAEESVPRENASDRHRPERENDAVGAADDPVRRAADESSSGGHARTKLVESTVVAAVTGVFVVLGGSAQIPPYLSLPVALAGVLWLFVRALPSVRRRGTDAPDGDAAESRGDTLDAESSSADPVPSSRPVGTDRRLKMEIAGHGGRMRQKELVETVDLSESAVSRRLSKLEEDGEVGRVCLGRENLVYLEGNRPEGADSPFAES